MLPSQDPIAKPVGSRLEIAQRLVAAKTSCDRIEGRIALSESAHPDPKINGLSSL
jgi:hypothetical protein